MIWAFAAAALALAALVVRDELRRDGPLFPRFDGYYNDPELLVLPLADGWDPEDVLTTLAEIEAL